MENPGPKPKKTLMDMPDEILLDIVERATESNLEIASNPPNSPSTALSTVPNNRRNPFQYSEIMDILTGCLSEGQMDAYGEQTNTELKRYFGVCRKLFGMAEEVLLKNKRLRTLSLSVEPIVRDGLGIVRTQGTLGNHDIIYNNTGQLHLRVGITGHQWSSQLHHYRLRRAVGDVLFKCHAVRTIFVELHPNSTDAWRATAQQVLGNMVMRMQGVFGHLVHLQFI